MRRRKSLALGALAWVLATPAVAATRGVISADAPAHVVGVEIVQHDTAAPAAFADLLQALVLKEAALYGEDGQAITLRIELDKVHLKNPVQAMLIGDDNVAAGHVDVLDPSTGQPLGTFKVRVNAERRGDKAASIGMFVVGALDPTGAVDVGTTVASAGSAAVNHSGTETAMSANFAAAALRQTFGDARARAAHSPKH